MPPPEAPVLVAPAAFGGELRAPVVAAAIGRGLERAGLMAPDLCPVAGGGAGTIEALLPALGGEIAGTTVHDALGRPVPASFALLEDGRTALVEAVDGARPPAADAESSRAAGELIGAAVDAGAVVVVLAAGDSAPRDGGAGALDAIAARGGLDGARLVVLHETGVAIQRAAGGLAGALASAYGAVLERGPAWVLDALGFDARMRAARAVVSGDGVLDRRTLDGRVAGEICVRARQAGVPAHAVTACHRLEPFDQRILDLQVVLEAGTRPEVEEAGMALGAALREGAA